MRPFALSLMFLGVKYHNIHLNVGHIVLKAEQNVQLLGINIDFQLTFSKHIKNICKVANNKLCGILRLRSQMSQTQTKFLINAHVI